MLGELVRPKDPVGVVLADPVLVHVGEEIELAVRLEPLVNRLAGGGRDGGTVGGAVGGVGHGLGVILAASWSQLRSLTELSWPRLTLSRSTACKSLHDEVRCASWLSESST